MPIREIIFIAAGIILAAVVFAFATCRFLGKNARIRRTVAGKRFTDSKSFEKGWITERGEDGYKYRDFTGCYIILVFDKPVLNGNYSRFENIYIGQSLNVCRRVHNHFNGKGNGDVYADIRGGKHVYVQLLKCRKKDMNELERRLIKAFGATRSYNSTRGGGRKRR